MRKNLKLLAQASGGAVSPRSRFAHVTTYANRAFDTPRPALYPGIPAPIFRRNWRTQPHLPGPHPLLSDWLTLTFIRNTP
ncbi:MAG: hypothetical protein KJS70_07210, partial [Actinomycetales bacterium]|nr:hypothetical protein [Actinomycetales bacterium]